MSTTHAASTLALGAYESLAEHYDEFTDGYQHDRWCQTLIDLAEAYGLTGRRHLDVACGTGKSFEPFLLRDFQTIACDVSPAMVRIARRRAAGRATVLVADMRRLPALGPFDLITCLDDALNYLLDERELVDALTGMRRGLAQQGLLVFDVNTLSTYRDVFVSDFDRECGGTRFRWRGERTGPVSAGATVAATIEVQDDVAGTRGESRHVQRHHPAAVVHAACVSAGLRPLAVWGQLPGVRLAQPADEERHSKLVWLATPAGAPLPLTTRPRRPT